MVFFFFWFLISSWCRLCWQPMTAEKKKYQNTKEKKKKALPKPKDLKNKQKNQTHMARNGEDPIVLEAHGIYFSL